MEGKIGKWVGGLLGGLAGATGGSVFHLPGMIYGAKKGWEAVSSLGDRATDLMSGNIERYISQYGQSAVNSLQKWKQKLELANKSGMPQDMTPVIQKIDQAIKALQPHVVS